MKRAGRAVWLAVLALVGGAVVSVLVAEGIGVSGAAMRDFDARGQVAEMAGCTCVFRCHRGCGWEFLELEFRPLHRSNRHDNPFALLPRWARFWYPENWPQHAALNRYVQHETVEEWASGWPLLAFSMDGGDQPLHQCQGGVMLPTSTKWSPRVLVWRPIPLGLAADTLFYAAGLAGLAGGARLLVRGRRRRRGACAACGYDRRGLAADAACPECGGAGPAAGAPA